MGYFDKFCLHILGWKKKTTIKKTTLSRAMEFRPYIKDDNPCHLHGETHIIKTVTSVWIYTQIISNTKYEYSQTCLKGHLY